METSNTNFYVYASDDEHRKMSNLSLDEAIKKFQEHYTNSDNHYLAIGVETAKSGVDLLSYSNNVLTLFVDDQKLINSTPELRKLTVDSKIKLDRFTENLKRAKTTHKTISDVFRETGHDCYDTCDTIFDVTVTCDEMDEIIDEHSKFCQYVHDNVYVLRAPDGYHSNVLCDYSEFIYRHYDAFEKATNETWRFKPSDEDDFVYEWCGEIHSLFAGYGSESTYEYLNKLLSESNTSNDKYIEYLEKEFIPYLSKKDKDELLFGENLTVKESAIKKILANGKDDVLDLTDEDELGLSR